jgi:hypothetical protein
MHAVTISVGAGSLHRRDSLFERQMARQPRHPTRPSGDAEGTDGFWQRLRLDPAKAGQRRHHRPRRAEVVG